MTIFSWGVYMRIELQAGMPLIVEDNEKRLAWFREQIPSAFLAKDAHTAIRFLKRWRFDNVFLDYDLGVGRPTGAVVAAHLHAVNFPGRVVIHSGNSEGVKILRWHLSDLPHVRAIPFREFWISHRTDWARYTDEFSRSR